MLTTRADVNVRFCIEYRDRKHASFHRDDDCRVLGGVFGLVELEEGFEQLAVHCRRHDDDAKVETHTHDALEQTENKIGGDGALVSFVDDHDAVLGE